MEQPPVSKNYAISVWVFFIVSLVVFGLIVRVADAAELLGHDVDGTERWSVGNSNSAGVHYHQATFTPDDPWNITTFGVWLSRGFNDTLTDQFKIEICSFEFQANSSNMCDEVLATGTIENNILTNDPVYYQLDFDQDVNASEGTRYVVQFRRTGANSGTDFPLLSKSNDSPDNSNNYGDPAYPGDADVGHDYLGGYYIWDFNYDQLMPAYDLFGTIGLAPLSHLSVSATNTPIASHGIRWSGYGTLPSQLESGESTTNFYTRIFSTLLGVDETFSINSTSSTAPGYYETPGAALGISWTPGTYTVVTTQETTLRTSSATTTVTVSASGVGGGGGGGGGGGSWGEEGVPPILPPDGINPDEGFVGCNLDLMPTGFFDFIASPVAPTVAFVKEAGACFISTVINIVKGIAPFKWVYQFNEAWNTAISSATATPDVSLSVPSAQAGGTSRNIVLISSSSSTAGISGAMAGHVGSVKTFIGYALYLVFGFYLVDRALNTRLV